MSDFEQQVGEAVGRPPNETPRYLVVRQVVKTSEKPMTDTDTMERLWHKRLDSYHLKACRWWGEGVCDCNLASLIREIAHLERERDERLTVDKVKSLLTGFGLSMLDKIGGYEIDHRLGAQVAAEAAEWLNNWHHGIEPQVDLEWPDDRTPETAFEPKQERER